MAPRSPLTTRVARPHDSQGHGQSPVSKTPRRRHHLRTAATMRPDGYRNEALQDDSAALSDGSHITSFWGMEPVPLPLRFARIKRNIMAGHEDALEASWARLLCALRQDAEHIEGLGAHLIPSIEFGDLDDEAQTSRFQRDLKRYGVGVVRKVVPRRDAQESIRDTVAYVNEQQKQEGQKTTEDSGMPGGIRMTATSETIDPACHNLFWSPAQMRMRAHPNVRRAQKFMMSLWDTSSDSQISAQHPITYADRVRVYGNNHSARHHHQQNGTSKTDATRGAGASQPPQLPEDWITTLQSSDGIVAQVDNGSLERWEPDGYQRAGTYNSVFRGDWERYDPWVSAHRSSATTDLYNGHGACSVFRMFQGVLALSVAEPGMIRLLPSPKTATAYYLLRPFFRPAYNLPEGLDRMTPQRQSEEWERYLAPENWRLTRDPDTVIHGAVPGHAQRVTERWHPHLLLRSSLITLPTLQPGDYILWHPDLPYHISSNDTRFAPSPPAADSLDALRMLVYIPAAPLTQTNALYLARQRKAFQRGQPGPDFDSSGRRNQSIESQDVEKAEADMERVGGKDALRAMGLVPWDTSELARSSTPSDVAMAPTNGTGKPQATDKGEADSAVNKAVKLANIILFPEMSVLG